MSLLRRPAVARALAGALIGRLPTAMVALALALLLREGGASFGLVGVAMALNGLGAIIGGPLLARLVDRRGQTLVLAASATAAAIAFGALATLDPGDVGPLLVAATVAGLATPPLEPALRALWPLLAGQENLQRAYALDAASQELVFVTGPLVVAACVAIGSPSTAMLAAAVLGTVGTAMLASTHASRTWRAEHYSKDLLGALRSRGVVVIVLGLAGAGASVGGLSVWSVAFAEDHPLPGGAGTLMAAYALGAFIGGVAHVRRTPHTPARVQIVLIAWYLALSIAPIALAPPAAATAALCVLAGTGLAPLLAVTFSVVDHVAIPGTITEAFAWIVALFQTGAAVGATVVGALLDVWALRPAALSLTLMAALGALTLTAGRTQLVGRDRTIGVQDRPVAADG